MNQDVTAPTTVRGRKIRHSLSDATAELALYEHARVALHNFRLSELAALSRGWYPSAHADIPRLRATKSMVSATVSAFNEAFAVHTAATLQESGGHLYSGATITTLDRSELPIDESKATTLERFVCALGEWKGLLAPDHFDAMARHVDRLLSDQEELDEDSTVPSPISFDDMLAYLASRPWDKAPAAGLNRKGQFSVSWTRSHPHTDVTLTFLGEGSVKWYVYGLGRKGTGSAAGTSDRADVAGILTRLGCNNWMAR